MVNYDFPGNLETYVHRVGRAGRLAADGHALSFLTRNLAALATPLLELLQVSVETPAYDSAYDSANTESASHALSFLTRNLAPLAAPLLKLLQVGFLTYNQSHASQRGSSVSHAVLPDAQSGPAGGTAAAAAAGMFHQQQFHSSSNGQEYDLCAVHVTRLAAPLLELPQVTDSPQRTGSSAP